MGSLQAGFAANLSARDHIWISKILSRLYGSGADFRPDFDLGQLSQEGPARSSPEPNTGTVSLFFGRPLAREQFNNSLGQAAEPNRSLCLKNCPFDFPEPPVLSIVLQGLLIPVLVYTCPPRRGQTTLEILTKSEDYCHHAPPQIRLGTEFYGTSPCY